MNCCPLSAALMRAFPVRPPQVMNRSERPPSAGQDVRVGSGVCLSNSWKACNTHNTEKRSWPQRQGASHLLDAGASLLIQLCA